MKLFHQRWFSIPKDKISAFIFNIAKKPGKITAFRQWEGAIGLKIKLMIAITSNINT